MRQPRGSHESGPDRMTSYQIEPKAQQPLQAINGVELNQAARNTFPLYRAQGNNVLVFVKGASFLSPSCPNTHDRLVDTLAPVCVDDCKTTSYHPWPSSVPSAPPPTPSSSAPQTRSLPPLSTPYAAQNPFM